MKNRTLGWIQNPANTASLKKLVCLFIPDSIVNKELRTTKIAALVEDAELKTRFINLLSAKDKIQIPYTDLKGSGIGKEASRKQAKCSGIVQAAIHGQGNKEYIDDWSADGFLRWAISVGFLDYDAETDLCEINQFGKLFSETIDDSEQEKEVLGLAYLSYPPAVRVLSLLNEENAHLTKFEIGANLGIVGEAGFTSVPQNLFVQGLHDALSAESKTEIRQNVEGDSDKYARMICGWLARIGWVKRESKKIMIKLGNTEYTETISHAFILTLEGKTKLKQAFGKSSKKKIPKIVYFEMLATKAKDKNYLRLRRANIIQCINKKSKTADQICSYLKTKGITETSNTIIDDIESMKNIGLNVIASSGKYNISDTITHLSIPALENKKGKSEITEIKDELREKLKYIDHKYLNLIDLSYDSNANRDFEIQTIALLTNELDFKGMRLGYSRRPDGIIYYDVNGTIIDTKAYSQGYNLPIGQQDEMQRYIEENQKRDAAINQNEWWLKFPGNVKSFTFLFVSSSFIQNIGDKIKNLSIRTKINGAVINSANLLLLAENIKAGETTYRDCFKLFGSNKEIRI
ncbi:hypothetical protein AGMMS50212_01490 [Spirochaetia bacterium]|nr:hypothetical protein AGMMS50212_01490 [Spirochaetia bacterium]